MNAKLTAKQTALLTAIAENKVDFFEDGLVEGSNGWSDVLTSQLIGIVADTAKGVAQVAKSLDKKGLLVSDGNTEDGESWFITAAGEAWFAENFPAETEEAATEEISADTTVAEVETPEGEAIVTEWTAAGMEDTVYWTEIKFADDSRTIKRRQKVSGAWRTDYWGAEFAGDKERMTTSAKVKDALRKGNFTR